MITLSVSVGFPEIPNWSADTAFRKSLFNQLNRPNLDFQELISNLIEIYDSVIHRVLLLLCLITTTISVRAQELKPGYIVNLKKDTVWGNLTDRTNSQLSSRIEFVKSGGNQRTIYGPSDILAFGFDRGRVFRRLSFKKGEINSQDSSAFFVKRSVEGKINLYALEKAKSKPEFFLLNKETNIWIHLIEPTVKEITDSKGNQYAAESQNHIHLLQVVKGENVPSSPAVRYKEKEIQRDILDYDQRFANEYPVTNYKPRVTYSHTLTGGVTLISGHQSLYRLAYYINRSLPESTQRVSFQMGVVFRQVNEKYFIGSSQQFSFSQQFSLLPVGFNIHSSTGAFRPFVQIGAGVDFWKYGSDKNIDNLSLAFVVGLGVKARVGKWFIVAELTPSLDYNNVVGNLGFSF